MGGSAYEQIAEMLSSGGAAPGERLSLRDLATRHGTSTMPVRQAVARLTEDGALEVSPNRAVRVPIMSRARFTELADLRQHLEGFAARRAAEAATDADIRQIADFEAAFVAASQDDALRTRRVTNKINRDFHFAIYRAARMPLLVSAIERLWLLVGPMLALDLEISPHRSGYRRANRHHGAAVVALRARDGAAAEEAIRLDIAQAAASILARGHLAADTGSPDAVEALQPRTSRSPQPSTPPE